LLPTIQREMPREGAGLVDSQNNLSGSGTHIGHLKEQGIVSVNITKPFYRPATRHGCRLDLDIHNRRHAVRCENVVQQRRRGVAGANFARRGSDTLCVAPKSRRDKHVTTAEIDAFGSAP
jgi:hypothetical protein